MMVIVRRELLGRPAEIIRAERHGTGDGRELIIIDKYDPVATHQACKVDQIKKHEFEPMISINKCEVKSVTVGKKLGKEQP